MSYIFTENGATGNSVDGCLALFSKAVRTTSKSDLRDLICKAFEERPEIAIALIYHLRDPRNGKGEKQLTYWAFEVLEDLWPETLKANLRSICIDFGCYKDLCHLRAANIAKELPMEIMACGIKSGDPLACKWAPSEKSHFDRIENGNQARELRKLLDVDAKTYRSILKQGREKANIVENWMCKGEWDSIPFSKVCAQAMRIYGTKAFPTHCPKSFCNWKIAVMEGRERANLAGIQPHQLASGCISDTDEILWKSLVNTVRAKGTLKRILPVIDVSGSMGVGVGGSTSAMDVAISLGLLCAECSDYRDEDGKPICMTFESDPHLIALSGHTLKDKVREIRKMPWGESTDFAKALLIPLVHAIKTGVSVDEFPDTIIVFSDMEFDSAGNSNLTRHDIIIASPHDTVKHHYETVGYDLPKLVYWNLSNRSRAMPVAERDSRTCLVSGFSKSLLDIFVEHGTDDMNPEKVMMNAIKPYLEHVKIVKNIV